MIALLNLDFGSSARKSTTFISFTERAKESLTVPNGSVLSERKMEETALAAAEMTKKWKSGRQIIDTGRSEMNGLRDRIYPNCLIEPILWLIMVSD